MTLAQSIRRALTSECNTDFARIFNFHPLFGQAAIARQLGVTREYLNRVLNGKKQSKRLMRRLRPYLGNQKRKNQYA